jgi:hypothetical protein
MVVMDASVAQAKAYMFRRRGLPDFVDVRRREQRRRSTIIGSAVVVCHCVRRWFFSVRSPWRPPALLYNNTLYDH